MRRTGRKRKIPFHQTPPTQAEPLKKGPHIQVFPPTMEFYIEKGKVMCQEVLVRNIGTTAVYLTWGRAKPPPELKESALPHDPTAYFHCIDLNFKLLPREERTCIFAFHSITAGSFCDAWHLDTQPRLATGLDDLRVYGICTQSDMLVAERSRFVEQMRDIQLEHVVHEMVNDAVLRVKTATPPPPDFSDPRVQEKIFEERNAPEGLYFSPFVWEELHKLVPRIQQFVAYAKAPGRKAEPASAAEAQILNLDDPDPALDVHVFEWDKSVAMLEAELKALRTEQPDPTLEELYRQLQRIRRAAVVRPLNKSPCWHPAYEAVLSMIDCLPDTLKKLATDLEVVDPASGRPLHRPFYAPDNPERDEKYEYWQKKREEPLAAAVAKDPDVGAKLEVLPIEPFVECLASFEEQAQEARFRDTLMAPAPTLQESFQLYSKKVNTEAEMGAMIVIYELNLAIDGITVVDGKVDISPEGDAALRESLNALQDLIDAGPQAIFVV